MCTISKVHDMGRDIFSPWINPGTTTITYPPPDRTDEVLRAIEAYRKMVEAALEIDDVLEQPDCVDPEKAALMKRVDELEQRLHKLERAK